MDTDNRTEICTIQEASMILNKTERTVYNYMADGIIKKVGNNTLELNSVLLLKDTADVSKVLYNKTQLSRKLKLPLSLIEACIENGSLKEWTTTLKRNQKLPLYHLEAALNVLQPLFLQNIKLYPIEDEFVHKDYNVALFQQYSFDGNNSYRDDSYMSISRDTNNREMWDGKNFVDVDYFFNHYENIAPITPIDDEKRMTKSKNNAVHLFIPLDFTDVFSVTETPLFSHGTFAIPIVNFFYNTWGIKNCGVRLWLNKVTNDNSSKDLFGTLTKGDKIVQISIKPAKQSISKTNRSVKELLKRNLDKLNSYAYGGEICIEGNNIVVTSKEKLVTLKDLQQVAHFPHKDIFDSHTLINTFFL